MGTTNRPNALPNDPSGLRRFVPLDCKAPEKAVEPYFDLNRDQLWGEALSRYRSGMRAALPRTLHAVAAAAAEQHRNRDELLEDLVAGLLISEGTLLEIMEALRYRNPAGSSMREVKRVAAALQNGGWQKFRVRFNGRFTTRWEKSE